MDFEFTSEQNMLRKSFAEFLSKECPFDLVKEIKKESPGYSKKIWKKMAELGWLGLIFEEKHGGSECSFLDLFILFEEIGKVLLPSPLFTSAAMAGLILSHAADDDQKGKYLPKIINGKMIATVALLDEKGQVSDTGSTAVAEKNDDGNYSITGNYILVPYADISDMILCCVNIKDDATGGPTLIMVNTATQGLSISAMDTITDEKKFALCFDNVSIEKQNIIGDIGKGSEYLDMVIQKAIVLKCAEMMGGFKQVLDMTVAYAAERKQFDVPIGKFQAIQHFCADIAIDLQGAELIAYQAASMMSKGLPCEKEVAMAKAWCSDTYRNATQISQQIHGGVGFTDEFNIGLFFKHAKESELMFGHSKIHRIKVADEIGL